MRNSRVLALWGIGVVSAMALGACATELQEPSATTSSGPDNGLTSDSGSETTSTSHASTGASTSTSTSGKQSAANTVSVTTTASSSSTESSTSTTQDSFVLGGTVTSSTTVSSTTVSTTSGGNTSGGNTSGGNTSGGNTSGGNTSGGNTSGGNTSGGNTNGFGGMGAVAEAAAASSTTGGGSCAGASPATAPVPLEPTDGWVDCSTNDIGIHGTFFTYEDGNGSSITSDFAGDEICVDGTAGQIVGGDNATWGAGLGVNLNQDDPEADVETWNAGAMGISGFRFNLSAMPPGTGLRLVYQNAGTDYCVEVTAAGPQTVLFEETAEACWSAGGDAPSGTMLEAIKWQVTTNATSEHDFAFCISDLAAIP